MFVQGIYESRIARQFGPRVLLGLHKSAIQRNQTMGLTSFMYYDEERIFQVVEGEQKQVAHMLGMIGRSSFHTDLKMRAILNCTERSFPHWAFGATHWQDLQFKRAFNTLKKPSFFNLDVLEALGLLRIIASRKRRSVERCEPDFHIGTPAISTDLLPVWKLRSG